ncbi:MULTISPECIES: cupin domain-containing protein [Pandoraea]|uniref:Cupin n=1 Tax=Pandoraea communis TaxID=2508297 RepID=A0A5E4R6S4_9BURK|nr:MULTISPECIES: cupin domain-containing protein [Pandoraea]EON13832.1 hypothetical protein C266_10354 [Pandoraea sp. SD6-2]MDM8359755.1 cupin domain-containing protein [Pandoraea communis]VVD59060.1 cupin [Pandoraea communis]VVE54447.1 cupin [Pandoraea communis]
MKKNQFLHALRFANGTAAFGEDWGGAPVLGDPKAFVVNRYESQDKQYQVGTWESSVGTWALDYSDWEYCFVLEGRFYIQPEGGERVEFSAGDTFVLEPGFKGTLEVVERTRKWYVFHNR